MVIYLQDWATYASFKAWLLVVEDWVSSYTHKMPNNLGPTIFCTMAHLETVQDRLDCILYILVLAYLK